MVALRTYARAPHAASAPSGAIHADRADTAETFELQIRASGILEQTADAAIAW